MPTWTTSAIPQRRQFAYWREMICQAFHDLTPDTDLRDGFRGQVTQLSLGLHDLARIDSQAQRVRRTDADIARSPKSGFYANLQVRGIGLTTQGGRTAVTHPGDITLIDAGRPFAFEFSGDFQQLSLSLPGDVLTGQLEAPVPTATRITTVSGVGAAIRHTLLAIDAQRLAPSSASRLAAHACGLLAVELQGPEAADVSAKRHRRLLDAALSDIDEHFVDGDLSPARTAARLGISLRLLHQVFAGHENSFTTVVRRRRLEQAHRDLGDPGRARLRIIDIAADNGFVGVTHFHRVFRQTYGYTPAQRRRDAGLLQTTRDPRWTS
jgi:AraC family transcriptional activator of tynA and feaB